jgi:hypothetical protein
VAERCLCLSQQPQDVVCPGLVCCTSRLFGFARCLAFGIVCLSLLGRCRGCRLRVEFLLPPRRFGGVDGGSLPLGFGLDRLFDRTAVMLDDFVRTLQVLCHVVLQVRLRLRCERAPPGFELRKDGRVRRVVRTLAVPGDGRGGFLQVRLQSLGAADPGQLFIAPGGKNAMDVLVFAVARGGDQLPQLVRIRDASRRHLADPSRASLQNPLADGDHVSRSDSLGQARFFVAGAYGRVGWWWRFNRSLRFAGCRWPGSRRGLTKQA